MILIGDKNIPYEEIVKISSINDIVNTSPNSIVLFNFNIDILNYTQKNGVKSAVMVTNIKDVIYASALEAYYIIPTLDIVQQTQQIANHYMFDSKILAPIDDESEIEKMALAEFDGIIYKHIIE